MFEIEMLPAREGDCLWVRYGSAANPKQILIDAGRSATYTKALRPRFVEEAKKGRGFELFVITHVDRDHIEGALEMLEDPALPVDLREIWFNGYDHLQDAKLETFGAVQGERLTAALLKRKARWNKKWNGKAVVLRTGDLATVKVAGLTLTLLSPDRAQLVDLIPKWEQECKEAGLTPGTKARRSELKGIEEFGAIDVEELAATPFEADSKEANGSSIALLAEYEGKRALLGADAHPDRLLASLRKLAGGKKRLTIDLFKIPHHGSEANVSRALLEALDCQRYLLSTNGSYFQHPRAVAMARILKFGGKKLKTIAFNYRSRFTEVWDQPALKEDYGYETMYPPAKSNGTLAVPVRD